MLKTPPAPSGLALARTRPLPRPRAPGLEVVTSHEQAPQWASRWCERLGLGLTVYRIGQEHLRSYSDVLVERVSRAGDRMVLLDRWPPSRARERRVVAALQDLPGDADVLAAAVGGALELEVALQLRHAVPLSFAVRSVGLAQAMRSGQRLLEDAAAWVAETAPELPVSTYLPRMRPQELVSGTDADLLVVGHPGVLVDTGHGLVTLAALACADTGVLFVPRLR